MTEKSTEEKQAQFEPEMSACTEKLYAFASEGRLAGEIKAARAEYFEGLRDVTDEEEFYEERMSAFLEWYCIERPIGRTGITPLMLFIAASRGSGHEEMLAGLYRSRRSLFDIGGHDADMVKVTDLFTGDVLEVGDTRMRPALKRGDVVEARLIPWGWATRFGGTFIIHPRKVARLILREIVSAKRERRLDAQAFMKNLAVLWVRSHRYRSIDPELLYTKDAVSRPNVGL